MEKNATPIIIALPGSGKSTLSGMLAKKFNKTVLSTDPQFRIFRAIPATSQKEEAKVMQRFLKRAQKEFPDKYQALYAAAKEDTTDKMPEPDSPAYPQKRTHLRDSSFFRDFGEDIFRTFEIEMLAWLHEKGRFEEKIPELSGSALLYEENRKLFSKENGYIFVHLDVGHEDIVKHLKKDFYKHLENSKMAGEWKPIRGAYEKAVRQALMEQKNIHITPENAKELCIQNNDIVEATLSEVARKAREERHNFWMSDTFNAISIKVEANETPEQTFNKILQEIKKPTAIQQTKKLQYNL